MECATSFNVTGVCSCFLVLVDFEVFAVLSDADSELSADVHAKSEVTDCEIYSMVYSIFGKKKTVMENRENISIDRIISRYRRTGSERIYREVCKCAGEIPCDRPG